MVARGGGSARARLRRRPVARDRPCRAIDQLPPRAASVATSVERPGGSARASSEEERDGGARAEVLEQLQLDRALAVHLDAVAIVTRCGGRGGHAPPSPSPARARRRRRGPAAASGRTRGIAACGGGGGPARGSAGCG